MGRAPCCDKTKVKRGPWSPEEDSTLIRFLETHGSAGNWIALPQKAGLKRCGKSCRLRWLNYLRPNIKHGNFTKDEDEIICTLYTQMGSRWSLIASNLPGRTDNDVKNYWNTKLKKKLLAGKVISLTTTNSYMITSNKFPEKSCNRKNDPHELLDSSISTPPSSSAYDHHHHNHLHFSSFSSQPQIISSSPPPPFPILTDHMGYGSSSTIVNSTHEISLISSDPTHPHFSHHGHVSEFSTNLNNSSSSIFTSSQEGGSSSVSVSADSSSLAMESNKSLSADGSAVHEDLQGGILMDFSFGVGGPTYNEFFNSSSGIWFQDQKASHEEAGLSYCCYPNLGDQSSSYADIKQAQGLINQSVINQY